MFQVIRRVSGCTVFCFFVAPLMASEEESVPWRTVSLECKQLKPIGKVTLIAEAQEEGVTSLKMTAFGRTQVLGAADLAKLQNFPLDSLSITHEVGYKELGGHCVHFKFKRVYYNANKELVQELAVVSLHKEKPDEVAVSTQSKILRSGA